eukprot:6212153-Pleurochrysis_carterae.AAC.3
MNIYDDQSLDIHIMTLCLWSVFRIITLLETLIYADALKSCTHLLLRAQQRMIRPSMKILWLADTQKKA